ncbi:MAG: sensor domain-containing diguanylate cyclase, partial [Novosphingobium sp.]|nr:sensor domain-containing diguanylate cyclase [Novosphingobium sp.]
MFRLPLFRQRARLGASVLETSERETLVERFDGLKRQIPLLYAVAVVNLVGFYVSTSGQYGWATTLYAAPVSGIIFYRLHHWHRLARIRLTVEEMRVELHKSVWFSRLLSLLFLAWSMSILVGGERDQQRYIILFGSLASVGCSVALASVPRAAKPPLMLIALPTALWSMTSGDLSYFFVGVSLAVLIALILRMLAIQEQGFSTLMESKAAIAIEREKVRFSEERYEYIGRATNDLIWDWDIKTDTLFWNDAVHNQLGYSREDNHPTIEWWQDHVHPDHRDRVVDHVRDASRRGEETFEDEFPFRRSDGTYAYMYHRGYIIRDAEGVSVRMVGAMQDFTRRKLAEEGLLFAASRDHLTSLPNRGHFNETLQTAVTEATTGKYRSSLLLLDLDDFKQVNDSLGHDAGDALLKELASRLTECIAGEGELARLGGDEFAIILKQVGNKQEVEAWARVLLEQLRKPFMYQGSILDCAATIGVAIFPDVGSTPETVLKDADIALYVAKTNKRGGFAIFAPVHRAELQLRSTMVSSAKTAVRENRIAPFYQPKISFEDGSISGFE